MFTRVTKEDMKVIFHDIGAVVQWSSATFLVPLAVALIYMEPWDHMVKYAIVAAFAFLLGFVIQKVFKSSGETDLRRAFLAVTILWLIYTTLAALPFMLIHNAGFLDSFFETMSAITTTGLTALPLLDSLPKSLIFWRSFVSWVGGIGFVVIAMVGIISTYSHAAKFITAGGREERLRPSLKNTVREIMLIYTFLTAVGVGLLYFSGLGFFEAVNYSMSAISTTGMDISTQGLIGLHNYWIDLSLIIIMVLGATSFYTHYMLLRKRQYHVFWQDKEFQVLMVLGVLSSVMILPKMVLFYQSNVVGLEYAFFHAFSALTCGGFSLEHMALVAKWEDFIKLVLIGVMFIGGAAGSTAGGIKISRFWIFLKSIYWKIKETVLPAHAFFARKFEDRNIDDEEVKEIIQFILLYLVFIILGTLVLTAYGHDLGNSAFEVVSAQSNAGISTGISHPEMPAGVQIMLIFNMLVGRLEIIPILSLIGFLFSGVPRLKKAYS